MLPMDRRLTLCRAARLPTCCLTRAHDAAPYEFVRTMAKLLQMQGCTALKASDAHLAISDLNASPLGVDSARCSEEYSLPSAARTRHSALGLSGSLSIPVRHVRLWF